MLSTAKLGWSTAQLEAIIRKATAELSDTLQELRQLGAPALAKSVLTLQQLHQCVLEFRMSVSEHVGYSCDTEASQYSLEDLLHMARRTDDDEQQPRDMDELSGVLHDLLCLSSRSQDDTDIVDWVKQSSFDLLQDMPSEITEATDDFLQRTLPFAALHRLLMAGGLSDEEWEKLMARIDSWFPKSLSVALRRGRIYIVQSAIIRRPRQTEANFSPAMNHVSGNVRVSATKVVSRRHSDLVRSLVRRSEAEMAFWTVQSLGDVAAANKRLMSLLDEAEHKVNQSSF